MRTAVTKVHPEAMSQLLRIGSFNNATRTA